MYDCIIVGCGFCGSVMARRLAEEMNKMVLVIDRRNHIAGNMYDFDDTNNIRIQKYGPHIFHTNNDEIYTFVSRFTEWIPSKLICRAEIDGKLTPSPFNFSTIDTFFPDEAEEIKKALLEEFHGQETATIVEMLEHNNPLVKKIAEFLFEKDYRLYTSKQWGIPPSDIDPSVLKRVPVVLSYGDSFFRDKYEAFPKDGFVNLFKNLLNHKNITVKTNTEAVSILDFDFTNGYIKHNGEVFTNPVLFTGPLDVLMNYEYGQLPYRSLHFDFKKVPKSQSLDAPLEVFPQADDYTRITDYSQFPIQKTEDSITLAYEYPMQYSAESKLGNEPYYPIINDINTALYNKYLKKANRIPNLFVCGRLADYKYYNMDNAIARAFDVYKVIKDYYNES